MLGTYAMNHLNTLTELGGRFQGVDLSMRRITSPTWPKPWRIALVASKNERSDYRITLFADTSEKAVEELAAKVAEVGK